MQIDAVNDLDGKLDRMDHTRRPLAPLPRNSTLAALNRSNRLTVIRKAVFCGQNPIFQFRYLKQFFLATI